MGENSLDPLNMARAKLTSSQTCWSWRATVRNVRKREGTVGPQDVLVPPWPSLRTFYFSGTSHRGHIHCLWKSKMLQDSASAVPSRCFKYTRTEWHIAGPRSLGQARLASLGTLEGWGAMQESQSCLPFPGKSPAWPVWVTQLVCHFSSHCVSEIRGQSWQLISRNKKKKVNLQ